MGGGREKKRKPCSVFVKGNWSVLHNKFMSGFFCKGKKISTVKLGVCFFLVGISSIAVLKIPVTSCLHHSDDESVAFFLVVMSVDH